MRLKQQICGDTDLVLKISKDGNICNFVLAKMEKKFLEC